jgi:hypothetical protein
MLHRLGTKTRCTALVLLGMFGMLGCEPGDFSGSRHQLRFRSNLGPPWSKFAPTMPVATGSVLRIDAIDDDDDDDDGAPETTVTVADDNGMFDDVVVDVDHFAATVVEDATATITFTGRRTDDVVVTSTPLVRTEVVDPVRDFATTQLAPAEGLVATLSAHLPQPTSPLALTAGARLGLGVVAFGAEGRVATNAERFAFGAEGAVSAVGGDHVVIVAAANAPGERGQIAVSVDGEPSTTLAIELHDVSEAASLELIRLTPGVAIAVVRLADGSVLWQPPVQWEVGAAVSVSEQAAIGTDLFGQPFDPVRNDLLLFSVEPNCQPGAPRNAYITARVGAFEQTLDLGCREVPPEPEPAVEPESCATSSMPACGIACVALLRRRRARHPSRL